MTATSSVFEEHLRAETLGAELSSVIERSRQLIRRSWEICLGAYTGIQPIAGGSADFDSALILGVITDAPLCVDCIAKKTGVPVPQVERLLGTLGDGNGFTGRMESCAACLDIKQVFQQTNGAKRRTRDSILTFLAQNAGEAFCADCISTKLFAGKNVDVAMRHLEGYGVSRHHGRCSKCGNARLVATVPRRPDQTS